MNVVDATGRTTFSYYTGGLATKRTTCLRRGFGRQAALWASDTVTYTYNNARLRSSLTLQQPAGSWAQNYYYYGAHRLRTNTSPAGTFAYS